MYNILIDPGHGGRDPGAVGKSGLKEKDVVFAVALKAREFIVQKKDWFVTLTRTGDFFIPLRERAAPKYFNCFISIHCNAAVIRQAHGTETFYFRGRDSKLAEILQKHLLIQLKRRDRGVKVANTFTVLRINNCPASLVELAFISNPAEEIILANRQGQEASARAIADGIIEFLTPEERIYVVQQDDSLWRIASSQLGNGTRWHEIAKLNNLKSHILTPGQVLKLP